MDKLTNLVETTDGDIIKIYEAILELNDNDFMKVRIFIDEQLSKNRKKLKESEDLTRKGFEFKNIADNLEATRKATMAKNKAEAGF